MILIPVVVLLLVPVPDLAPVPVEPVIHVIIYVMVQNPVQKDTPAPVLLAPAANFSDVVPIPIPTPQVIVRPGPAHLLLVILIPVWLGTGRRSGRGDQ